MTIAQSNHSLENESQGEARLMLEQALAHACHHIAPSWPLDQWIAVNPFWGRTDRPIEEVSAMFCSLTGARLLMPRTWYRKEYEAGRVRTEHLRAALEEAQSTLRFEDLVAELNGPDRTWSRRARFVDVIDSARDLDHEVAWNDFVVTSMSQFCAAYFDEGQASFGPDRKGGLYGSWRRQALADKGPDLLMGLKSYFEIVPRTPMTALEMIRLGLKDLQVPAEEWGRYLASLLLDVKGWASWCMYLRWQAELQGGQDDTIIDLLAIRMAWEWKMLQCGNDSLTARWKAAMAKWPQVDIETRDAQSVDWIFQRALEMGWQSEVLRNLPLGLSHEAPSDVAVQAAFCIDVRSEVFRRALEAQSRRVQTLGFAGFFGMPIEYQALRVPKARPQLPGLLAPTMRATDRGVSDEEVTRKVDGFANLGGWKKFKTGAVSTFTFVEAMGLTYVWDLFKDSFGRRVEAPIDETGYSSDAAGNRKPRLSESVDGQPLSLEARCDLAAGVLKAMSLTRGYARLVLLAGHGSETQNNPHAAGLDCGACCGQSGEVNARVAAGLLNDPEVRSGLLERGITVPETTHFIPGLHNTTTDDVRLFDVDELPASHAQDLGELKRWLEGAGVRARSERSALLDLTESEQSRMHEAIRGRARDWSQVRPEWGLAGNASFLVAPREHTRHMNLKGRSFLHDYRWEDDTDFSVLELIMTAPMVVTHWINFQYYASTVDNVQYGSGNKVLHNVVGGRLGVFEGNGGDLRIGLSMQSLHDGERFVHAPLRLSVFIEAPQHAIAGVMAKHEKVHDLVTNGWLELYQIDGAERSIALYRRGEWQVQESPLS